MYAIIIIINMNYFPYYIYIKKKDKPNTYDTESVLKYISCQSFLKELV